MSACPVPVCNIVADHTGLSAHVLVITARTRSSEIRHEWTRQGRTCRDRALDRWEHHDILQGHANHLRLSWGSWTRGAVSLLLILLFWGLSAHQGSGQTLKEADENILRSVYSVDTGAFTFYMKSVNRSSYAIFAIVPASMWTRAAVGDERTLFGDAYRTSLASGAAFLTTLALKHTIQRERPYQSVEGIDRRSDRTDVVGKYDPFSFPSGHATISFALATSLSLSNPVWYVSVPAYLVATSIGISRIWHGMHYPSDVLAGAALGTAVSLVIWALDEYVTPARWREFEEDIRNSTRMPTLTIRLAI